jgi:BirA family transcriptional regulator, biotin operon repressor / biotin---[acetyl-CoA-carboxylase] ligase
MAGIAVHDAIADLGLRPDIKWVNDILIDDKKVSGILAEAIDTDGGVAVIVGIGVNLTAENFPDEIADTATSILSETQQRLTADQIAQPITRYISQFYDVLMGEDGPREIIENWKQRSTYFTGKNVRVSLDGSSIEGVTDGLEENGALRVKRSDGSVTIVQAGDVERLRSA